MKQVWILLEYDRKGRSEIHSTHDSFDGALEESRSLLLANFVIAIIRSDVLEDGE